MIDNSMTVFGPLLLVFSISLVSCGNGLDTSPPRFHNLMVDIQPWDTIDGSTAGDFLFTSNIGAENVVEPMAMEVESSEGGTKTVPELTFYPVPDAKVRAPLDAYVVQIEEDETEGGRVQHAVMLRTSFFSPYRIEIDHVELPEIETGDHVTAGQIIGEAGYWSDTHGVIQLRIDDGQANTRCAMDFLAPASKDSLVQKVTQMMQDWESVRGDSTIFDESAMHVPGCYEKVLTDI